MRKILSLTIALIVILITGCSSGQPADTQNTQPAYQNYKDIPGVTQAEIDALEQLLAEKPTLIYCTGQSTEAFRHEDGSLGGFAKLFGERLSELFGFKIEYHITNWNELKEKIDSKEVDLTDAFTATPERMQKYIMTDSIIQRSIKIFTHKDSADLNVTAKSRPVKCAFLNGSLTYSAVEESWQIPFEPVFIDDQSEVPDMLQSGEVDAFIEEGILEAAYDAYDFIKTEEYFPLTYSPISLTTGNPELKPLIDIIQKYLKNGGSYELTGLYNQGYKDYLKNKLSNHLTEEEKAYIQLHSEERTAILTACESSNYPSSFYNTKDKEFQGAAIDMLNQVSVLTGLKFKTENGPNMPWSELLNGLETGKYSIVSELLQTNQRKGRFLWTDEPYSTDNFAMISRADYPDVDINQISFNKVGILEGTAYADVFREWFPDSVNTLAYDTTDEAIVALEKGDIDLLMANQNLLSHLTNYLEKPGFKTNIVFNYSKGSYFGLNKDEEILCSIINKANRYIDTGAITESWKRKVFDYESKMLRDMIPYMIAFTTILLIALFVVFTVLIKNRRINKNLEKLITERTNELALQTRKLELVVKNYSGVIWSIDGNRNITLFDGLYLEKIGVTPSFLEGKSLSLAVKENRYLDIIEMVEKTFNEGPQDCVSEIDGEFFRSHTTPIRDDLDNITGVVGDTVNITETYRLQADLQAAIEVAKNASKAKGDFLSRMSHEIRTPLNAVIGMNSIAMNTNDSVKMRDCHEKIDNASKHLLGVINDILDMSKIEADKFELSYNEFDFEKVLMNITNVVNFRTGEKKQNLIVNLTGGVPDYIFGDELRLSQVITNLLSNAVKFTPENGTVMLNVEKTAELKDEITLQITITDNGIGISKEQQSRLFTSFEQADGNISRKFGGTGLGLAISKRIVELMGGKIWIESELGEGSKFIFTMRAKKGRGKTHTKISPEINKDNIHILAVDDSEETRICFANIMEAHGLPCGTATSGSEALEMVKRCEDRPYNIFFIDWQMPEMDGIELTKRIKEITGDNSVVFMISVADWNTIEKEALSAGVKQFVPKPLFPSLLINAVNECLGAESAKTEVRALGIEKGLKLNGHTILIAEDVEINQEIMIAVLEDTGVQIDFADNGQAAVSMFRANPGKYSLILMDIHMPEMDGYDATRAIRALELSEAKDIPIIAMTANVFKEDIDNCLAVGMNDHVGKPVESDKLFKKLKQYLSKKPRI